MSAKVFLINKPLSKHYLLKIEDSRSGNFLQQNQSRVWGCDINQYVYQTLGLQKQRVGPKKCSQGLGLLSGLSSPGRICKTSSITDTIPHAELEELFLQLLIEPDITQITKAPARRVISLWVHVLH